VVTGKLREGLAYGLAAYGLWGLVPFYFRLLKDEVPPTEILAHRVIWSAVFLAAILTLARRWQPILHCFRTRLLWPLVLSALLVAVNWLVYILSVKLEKIVQASLGYYVTPLVSVLIGLVAFRERLRPGQWAAVVLATGGVIGMTLAVGEPPWIALTLAISFGLYGAIRKTVPVDGLVGLAVESFVLLPAGIAYLAWMAHGDMLSAGSDRRDLLLLLALSGVVTAVPLLCFGQAARRMPLSILGFLQFLSPTLQLAIAVCVFDEATAEGTWAALGLTWAAVALFALESVLHHRKVRAAAGEDVAGEDERAASHGEGAEPPRETARQPSL
jgi:chloramphenicol-sensitive protein RarD